MTAPELRRWLESLAEVEATVPARVVLERLPDDDAPAPPPPDPVPTTWRERLWTVPSETRLGVHELAEALGRPRSWIYARTQATAEDPLPFRKLGGTLMFAAGELRYWIREREEAGFECPMDPPERSAP